MLSFPNRGKRRRAINPTRAKTQKRAYFITPTKGTVLIDKGATMKKAAISTKSVNDTRLFALVSDVSHSPESPTVGKKVVSGVLFKVMRLCGLRGYHDFIGQL